MKMLKVKGKDIRKVVTIIERKYLNYGRFKWKVSEGKRIYVYISSTWTSWSIVIIAEEDQKEMDLLLKFVAVGTDTGISAGSEEDCEESVIKKIIFLSKKNRLDVDITRAH